MASVWITRRTTRNGEPRFRCEFRLGGREARTQYGGSFRTRREALERGGGSRASSQRATFRT